ncbi:hypothetical protein J7E32_09110 [Bacillus sp. ISL-55]|nr:hypothetical protein [Bacillus sp. ISL-55]
MVPEEEKLSKDEVTSDRLGARKGNGVRTGSDFGLEVHFFIIEGKK